MAVAGNKILNIEPVAVPTSVGNLLNCAITSLAGPIGYTQTQPYLIVKHARLVNNTGAPITVTLYKGVSGGSSTSSIWQFPGVSVPANGSVDTYVQTRFESNDFLTGVASATGVVLNIDAEIGVS
jgi:hypothetical protein